MSQAYRRIGDGLSLGSAIIIAGAAGMLGVSTAEQTLTGIAGLGSADGLTRILSPVIIAIGLVASAIAIASLVGSWRTVRSRGRRQGVALVAGLLAAIGAGWMYVDGPRVDQMLPAFAFATAALGTGVAAAGWILGWSNDRLPAEATVLRTLGAATAVAVAALPPVLGFLMGYRAAHDAELPMPRAERAQLIREADSAWDHPFQRLAYLELAITSEGQSVFCGTNYTVEAFTLFGLRPDFLHVNECGVELREAER